jgi:surface polysaccharide O-acyltransferase-like enzyme
MGALAAVGIHVLQIPLTDYHNRSSAWLLCALINRALLFAVPAFLLLTTVLLTRKLLKDRDLKTYYQKRISGVLTPYLLWSLPHAAVFYAGAKRFHFGEFALRLLTGKSFFHLYFLGLILQLYLVLPLLVPLVRRRPPFALIALTTLAVTLAVYWLNRLVLHLPFQGSVILWHVVSVGLGLWLGSREEPLETVLRRALPYAGVATLFSAAFYLPLAVANLRNERLDTFHYQLAEWGYTNSASLFLLALATRMRPFPFLLFVGVISMQMYLLHRIPIYALDRLVGLRHALGVPLSILLATAIGLAIPILVAKLLKNTRLSALLFGR